MIDEIVPPELDIKDFKFEQLCKFRIFESSAHVKPTSTSLITSSSKYGLTFIGVDKGFKVLRTTEFIEQDKIHAANRLKHTVLNIPSLVDVPVGIDVTHLALSCDDLTLAVATCGSGQQLTYLYDTRGIVGQTTGAVQPFHIIAGDGQAPLKDLAWNPVEPNLLLICYSTGRLDIYAGQDLKACVPDAKAKCVCWSPKGKQLVAGKHDGSLMQFDPDLNEKKKWTAHGILSGPFEAVDVVWLSTFSFLVAYIQDMAASSEQPTVVLINGSKDGQASYTLFEDVCFGSSEGRQRQYYFTFLQKWDMVIAASSNSSEIAVIGKHLNNSSKWTRWNVDDSARAECPLTDDYHDTFPIGITIDLSSQVTVAAGDDKMHPPSPLMLLLTTGGLIVPYHVFYMNPGTAQITVPPQSLDLSNARKGGNFQAAPISIQSTMTPSLMTPSLNVKDSVPQLDVATPGVGFGFGVSETNKSKTSSAFSVTGNISHENFAPSSNFGAAQGTTSKFATNSISGDLSSFLFKPNDALLSGKSDLPTGQSSFGVDLSATKPHFSFGSNDLLGTTKSNAETSLSFSMVAAPVPTSGFNFTNNANPGSVSSISKTNTVAADAASVRPPATTQQSFGSFAFAVKTSEMPSTVVLKPPAAIAAQGIAKQITTVQSQQTAAGTLPSGRSQSPQALPPPYQGGTKAQTSQPPPQYTPLSPTLAQPATYPRVGIQPDMDESISNAVDQKFSRSILDEIQHFKKELGEMHTKMNSTDFHIGSKEDMKRLKVQTQEVDRFCKVIKITVQEQNKDIQNQRALCLDMFSMVEECRMKQHRENDPKYLDLLKSRALDPGSKNRLEQLQLQHQVLEQRLREVDHILDIQWNDYQTRKKNKTSRVQLPTSDTVYRVVKSNIILIMAQMKKLQELEEKLKQLKLYNRTSVWSNPSTCSGNDIAELSSLADALLSKKQVMSLSVKSSESSEKQLNKNRVEQLREYLCQQPVPIVKSTKPGNLSVLRIPDSQIEQPSLFRNPQGQSFDLEGGAGGNFIHMDRRSSPVIQTTALKSTEINRKHEQKSSESDKNMKISLQKVLQTGENKGTIPPKNVQGKPSPAAGTAASNQSQSKTSSSMTGMYPVTFVPASTPTKGQPNFSIPKTVNEFILQKESAPFVGPARVPTQESATGFAFMNPPSQNVVVTQHPQVTSMQETQNTKYEDITPTESENDREETEDDEYDEDEEDDSSESYRIGFGQEYNMPSLADKASLISSTPINTRPSYQSSQAGNETITPNIPVNRKLFETEESKPSSMGVLNFGPIANECSSFKTSMLVGTTVYKTMAESKLTAVTAAQGFTFNPSVTTGAGSQSDSKAAAGFTFSFLADTPKFGSKTDIPSELKSEAQSFPKTVMQSTVSKTETQSTASGDVKAQGENAKSVTVLKAGTASSGSLFAFGGSTTKPVSVFSAGNTTGTATNLFGKSAASTESSTVKTKINNPATTTSTVSSNGQAAVDLPSDSTVPVAGNFFGFVDTASVAVTAAEPSNAATAGPNDQPSVPGGLATSGAETKASALLGQVSAASAVPLGQTTSSSSTAGVLFGQTAEGIASTDVGQPAPYNQSTFSLGSGSALFVQAATVSTGVSSQPTSSSGLFGQSSSTTPTNGGLFGKLSTNGAAPFGQSSTSETSNGGLFGQLVTSNSASSSGGFFGQPVISSTAPATGLFGQPLTTTTAPATGFFGQPVATTTAPATGLFDQPLTTTTAPATGLFGQPLTTTTAPATGFFGQPVATTTAPATGLFDQPLTTTTAPATGLFGQPVATTTAPAVGLFGQPLTTTTAPATGLFGQPVATTTAPATGLFGQPLTTTMAPATGLFGQPVATTTAPATGLFGQPLTTTTAPATGLFVQPLTTTTAPATGLFGQPLTTTTATTTGPFSQPATAAVGGLFGQPTVTSDGTSLNGHLFNQAAPVTGGLFGQSPQGSSGGTFGQAGGFFGQPSSSSTGPFGSPSSTASSGAGLFSQTPSSGSGGIFGQPSGGSLFGTTPGSFGASTKASVFGSATSGTGFGFGPNAMFFGKPSFGQSPFGQTSSTGSSVEQNDGGLFSGLGGKPSAEKANTNVFGTVPAFGSAQGLAPSFGSGQAQSFGSALPSDNSHGLFSGGAFSGGMGVGSTGFGAIKQESPTVGGFGTQPAFGGAPAFGSTPAFGSSPRFSSQQTFGSTAFGSGSTQNTFGSSATFGSTAFGSSEATSGFAGFANTSSPSFGALAHSTETPTFGGFGGSGNTFSNSPSFTGYRG